MSIFGSHPFGQANTKEKKARAGGRVGRFEGYCRSPARARSVLRLGQVHVDGNVAKNGKNFTIIQQYAFSELPGVGQDPKVAKSVF